MKKIHPLRRKSNSLRYDLNVFVGEGATGADLFVWRKAADLFVRMPTGFRSGAGTPRLVRLDGQWSGGDVSGPVTLPAAG
jgi:hypothetical protein